MLASLISGLKLIIEGNQSDSSFSLGFSIAKIFSSLMFIWGIKFLFPKFMFLDIANLGACQAGSGKDIQLLPVALARQQDWLDHSFSAFVHKDEMAPPIYVIKTEYPNVQNSLQCWWVEVPFPKGGGNVS